MKKIHCMLSGYYPWIIAILFIVASAVVIYSCKAKVKPEIKKSEKISQVVHPEWSKNAVIYEVNIRQFTPEGTFNAFAEHLPRLQEMGVDILWLMPIHPIGEKNRKGSLGSYYSVKDYKDVNPEFGTMDDFRALVNKAHELGMYVILDWVPNHSSWDNPLIEEHPDWYTKDSLGNFVSPFDWSDVADLNYDSRGLRDYMTGALKFWIEEADVDGFRCDVAGMVPVDYWNEARPELDKLKPVFMLAEAEVPEHHDSAFSMSYGWEMHHIINQIAKGKMNAKHLHKYFLKNDSVFPQNSFRMYFTSNHDENSWNGTEYERMGDGAETFAALTYIVPGMPLIYSGQEAALNKRLRFFDKDTIEWNDYPLQDFYKTLNGLKHDNVALWNGFWGSDYYKIPTTTDTAIFAVMREKDGNRVAGIFNLSPKSHKIRLKSEDYAGDYMDVFTGEDFKLGKAQAMDMEPWEYVILVNK